MAYQALLFCPDEKIAATVTQVLGDLDFNVVPTTDPFGAVKRMMTDRFDAVVVDCDNEQNAALLFKSARGSAENQNALAVAIVEGQAGVAKAFRLGANLVLTKPVNVEQAKGTLRVARGLLKKNEAAKAAAAAAAPAAAAPAKPSPFKAVPPAAPSISFERVADAEKPAAKAEPAPVAPAAAAPMKPFPTTAPRPAGGFAAAATSASAAAAAPAKKAELEMDDAILEAPEAEAPTHEVAVVEEVTTPEIAEGSAGTPAAEPAPYKFTFGGSNREEVQKAQSAGSTKKVMGMVAAILALGAAAYYGWNAMHGTPLPFLNSDKPMAAPVKPAVVKPAPVSVATPAPATPAPTQQVAAVSQSGANDITLSTADTDAEDTAKGASPKAAPIKNAKAASKSAPIVLAHSSASSTKKSDDVAAPSVIGMQTSGAAGLPAITSSQTSFPKLQTLKLSQGVSQGLLIKKVQPVYPPSAMKMQTEGDVDLLATISSTGDITAVKVISGPATLKQPAVDAVKQWKYKPYLLNGEPVEIQTDITIRFHLPR